MKAHKLLTSTILVLLFSQFQLVNSAPLKKDCPLQRITTAYLDQRETALEKTDLGKRFKTYVENLKSLEKTGHFNNFKISSKSLDFQPSYNRDTANTVTMRATLEFELNYDAINAIFKKFKKATVNISTYDQKKCQ